MATIKPFDIRRLKPFQRRGAHLPGTSPEEEDKIAELDPNLKPEEHSYVQHYVGYADVLLHEDKKQEDEVQEPPTRNLVQMPQKVQDKQGTDADKPVPGTPRNKAGKVS